MARVRDITQQTFGRLTAVRHVGFGGYRAAMWLCICTCGTELVVPGTQLRSGKTRSCGCLIGFLNTKHGHATGKNGRTAEYVSWQGMKARCENRNHDSWKNYGGRGIKVCPEWRGSFEAFFRHMGAKPSPRYSIDRINNDGDYEPGNCRWATPLQQIHNRRKR